MSARAPIILSLVLVGMPAYAGDIVKHTSIESDRDGRPVRITESYAADNGDLMFMSFGIDVTATSSGGDISESTSRGALQDRMLFRADQDAIVVNDGGRCQTLGGDSGMPGYSAAEMENYQQQMAAAQAEMEKAYAEMAQQNPQLAEQMRNMMQGGNNPMLRARDQLELVETGNTRRIGEYTAEEFQVRSVSSGQVRHTVWATDIDDVEGGRLMGRNGADMYRTLKAALNQMGAGGFGAASIMGAIGEKMETHYPLLTIDHHTGSQTRFTGASSADVDTLDIGCGG